MCAPIKQNEMPHAIIPMIVSELLLLFGSVFSVGISVRETVLPKYVKELEEPRSMTYSACFSSGVNWSEIHQSKPEFLLSKMCLLNFQKQQHKNKTNNKETKNNNSCVKHVIAVKISRRFNERLQK